MENPIYELRTEIDLILSILNRIPQVLKDLPIFKKFIKKTVKLKNQLEIWDKKYKESKNYDFRQS